MDEMNLQKCAACTGLWDDKDKGCFCRYDGNPETCEGPKKLPKPYYEQDNITIYHGDCREILPHLPKVDLVLTDPPYGIDYVPEWKKWNGDKSDFSPIINDNKPFDPSPFLKFPTVVLFGANYYSDRLPIGGWICWDKRLDEKKDRMFGSPFELAWFTSKNTAAKSKMIRVLHGGVINADSVNGNNEKRVHPTQKPIEVMKRIVLSFTHEGDTVFDPFMGSGTTLVAAKQLGRKAIGIEIEEKYCEIAVKRLSQGVLPL